jgi:hypothetical protein
MSDSADTAGFETVPTDAGQPTPAPAGPSTPPGPLGAGPAADHPELLVGAAFVGGLLLASMLKRFAP